MHAVGHRRPNGWLLCGIFSVSLLAIEGLVSNEQGWPDTFTNIAFERGYSVPRWTFSPLQPLDSSQTHWVYPVLVLGVVALGITCAIHGLLAARTDRFMAGPPDAASLRRQHNRERTALIATVGLIGLSIWILVTAKFQLLDWLQFPPPVVVIQTLGLPQPSTETQVWVALLMACARTALSLVLALALAWPLATASGLRIGVNRGIASWLLPYTHCVSALPPIILFHVVHHFLSPNVLGEILRAARILNDTTVMRDTEWLANLLLTAWAIFWPIFAAACSAAESTDRRLVAAAGQLGATRHTILKRLIYPQARQQVFTGVGIGAGIGLIILLFAEGRSGVGNDPIGLNKFFYPNLGKLLDDSYQEGRLADLICVILFATLLALLLKLALDQLVFFRAPWLRRHDGAPASTTARDLIITGDAGFPELPDTKRLYDHLKQNFEHAWDGSPVIALRNIEAKYGDFFLRVDKLNINKGAFVSIIGESGAGKTSLVELVAGLKMQERVGGALSIYGRALVGEHGWTPEADGGTCVGVVHQDFALFPTMTLNENAWFGLNMRLARMKLPVEKETNLRALARAAFDEIMSFLKLPTNESFLRRYPDQVSGGQQQRIVIARALLTGNPILVVDEGFANIDQPTRGRIRDGLSYAAKQLELTVLCVSHDNQDVLRTSTTILYMENCQEDGRNVGRIVREATPKEFFYDPRRLSAAYFIGHRNIFCAEKNVADKKGSFVLRPLGSKTDSPFYRAANADLSSGPAFIPKTWVNPFREHDSRRMYSGEIIHDFFLGDSRELVVRSDDGLLFHALVQDDDYMDWLGDNPEGSSGRHIQFSIHGDPISIEG